MPEAAAGYRPDPGGQFASDVHRRVAAHLHSEEEGMGWPLGALLGRLAEDHATPIPPIQIVGEVGVPDYVTGVAQLEAVLADLKADGLVANDGEVWVVTQDGLDLLTGPIANEPEPDAPVEGPAVLDLGPVPIGGKAATMAGVKTS